MIIMLPGMALFIYQMIYLDYSQFLNLTTSNKNLDTYLLTFYIIILALWTTFFK